MHPAQIVAYRISWANKTQPALSHRSTHQLKATHRLRHSHGRREPRSRSSTWWNCMAAPTPTQAKARGNTPETWDVMMQLCKNQTGTVFFKHHKLNIQSTYRSQPFGQLYTQHTHPPPPLKKHAWATPPYWWTTSRYTHPPSSGALNTQGSWEPPQKHAYASSVKCWGTSHRTNSQQQPHATAQ